MNQERLNHLLIPNTHQNMTDLLDFEAVDYDSVSLNDYCRNLFGSGRV